MGTINSFKILLMVLAIIALILVADSVQGYARFPVREEEEMDFDRQLKIINKPALKSFKTKYGDIIDCVDIYKQLAFDNPLLKDHIIQMKPETISGQAHKSSNYMPKNIKCPQGSVAIKRTTKEDLRMAKSIKLSGLNHLINAHYHRNNANGQGHHSAIAVKEGGFGARARINVWSPIVKENQFSCSSIWVANGYGHIETCLQAGWMVVNNDKSRLYTYWTADGYEKTGCFNTQCTGFIQTSHDIALGLVLPASTINGSQFEIFLSLYMDQKSGNWWLTIDDKFVGYWPKVTIPALGSGARFLTWGGQVFSPVLELSPVMGSGYFPRHSFGINYGKTAYFSQIQFVTDSSGRDSTKFRDPEIRELKAWLDTPVCYNATILGNDIPGLGYDLYYGGPGGCTFPT